MAEQPNADIPLGLFSGEDSDGEQFEGFDARDVRRYAEIASKAPLFCSTPIPRAKRVRIERDRESDDSNSLSSLTDDPDVFPVENSTRERSSSSSLEGEFGPNVSETNPPQIDSALFRASAGENESSSSIEGEISNEFLEHSKQQLSAACADATISEADINEHTEEHETPKLDTQRKGKTKLYTEFVNLPKLLICRGV